MEAHYQKVFWSVVLDISSIQNWRRPKIWLHIILPMLRGMQQHRFCNTRNYLNRIICRYLLMMCISTIKSQLLLVFIDMLDKSFILEDKIVSQIILDNIPMFDTLTFIVLLSWNSLNSRRPTWSSKWNKLEAWSRKIHRPTNLLQKAHHKS